MIPTLWWALLAGNFAIGCGVMVIAGSLNDMVRSLQVPVPVAGQLVTVTAVVLGLGAPIAAALVGQIDRRRLLTLSLVWYAAGHALAALMPNYASLLPVRAIGVLGAAVFTPQAAAAVAALAPPEQRGRAMTFVFLGWSLASVAGLPLASLVAETIGWRWAFALVAAMTAPAAVWVWRTMPDGVRPGAMSRASWGRIATHPALVALVLVTACSAAGQFTLFSYVAPYFRRVIGASAAEASMLFLVFGSFGLIGNVLLARWIDRLGAGPGVTLTLGAIALSLALWPLAATPWLVGLVLVPWGLGCFASNSAQQVRLAGAMPALAPALVALNSSAMYLGQAIGAAGGGTLIAAGGYGLLAPAGLAWLLLAIGLSVWAGRRLAPGTAPA